MVADYAEAQVDVRFKTQAEHIAHPQDQHDDYTERAAQLGINDLQWVAPGGGSDGNITAAMGIPTIDGAGPVGAGGHSVNEWLDSHSVEPRMKLLKEIILYLSKK